MPRPLTLFTGQWADLSFRTLCEKAEEMGYDGLELACWGDHFEVGRALNDDAYLAEHWQTLREFDLNCFALSNHLVGQAVCDRIDERHRAILPAEVWGDGDPEGVRQRAAEEMKATARAARRFFDAAPDEVKEQHEEHGLRVNGFTGSSIWHLCYSFPPVLPGQIDAGYADFAQRWLPILDVFEEADLYFALEVHPTEIAFDLVTFKRALEAVDYHPRFGANFDPSHFGYQGVDYLQFLREFAERIFHVHIKDVWWQEGFARAGVFGGHTDFGDDGRYWDFRSPGRGAIDFEGIIRILNHIGYGGPLSVEWEDPMMDREHGATDAADFVRDLDFPRSDRAFDSAFDSAFGDS
ncbi:MAG: sugar phosphate isomerase/epimerase family protein [Planctomycetota bacterium]